MSRDLGEKGAFLFDDGERPTSHPRKCLPWRCLTAGCMAGVACLLAASALVLPGPAPTGGLTTRLANEVLVLANANSTTNATPSCSDNWKNCLTSKCCKSKTFRCYKKDVGWAQCRDKCAPGMIDPYDLAKPATEWSCEDWDSDVDKCSGDSESCTMSKCCRNTKQRCFRKNKDWAQCRVSCAPGVSPHDKAKNKHVTPWSCEKIDTSEVPNRFCSKDVSSNCFDTRCCQNSTSTCFKKDDGWAACNKTCTKDFNPIDPPQHRRIWSCDLM